MYGIVGNGQVGQHIAEAFDRHGIKNHLIGRDVDGDMAKYRKTDVIFDVSKAKPDDLLELSNKYTRIIYTSSFRDVNQCEENPAMADRLNFLVPTVLSNYNPIVYISTDYVFGKLSTDAPRPISGKIGEGENPDSEFFSGGAPSVYGKSKRRGELGVLNRDGIVVRIASPFGKWKSPLRQSFVDMVASSFKTLELPVDQIISPTYLPEAAETLMGIAVDMQAGGMYHLVNEGSASYRDLGAWVRSAARNKHKINVRYSDPKTDRLRPNYSALQNNKLPKLSHWAEAVEKYVRG